MIRRVAAALMAVDGFTGLPIADGSAWVKSGDGASPVRKADGCYVFWDNGSRRREFQAGGTNYVTQRVLVEVEELAKRGLPLLRVYLAPGPSYPFPPGIKWRELPSSPGGLTEAVWEGTENMVRLQKDFKAGGGERDLIYLKKPEGLELEDRRLAIRRKNSAENEIFTLGAKEEEQEGAYRLRTEIKNSYEVSDSELLLVYTAAADSRGYARIPCPE